MLGCTLPTEYALGTGPLKNIMTTATEVKEYPIEQLVVSEEFTIRTDKLDPLTVERYQESLDQLPPIDVFQIGEHLVLVDGFHRLEAFVNEGRDTIPANVHEGTKEDALAWAAWCNAKHGRPLSTGDMRKAADRLFNLGYSEEQVASLLGRSKEWVGKLKVGYEVKTALTLDDLPKDSTLELLYPAGPAMWAPLASLVQKRQWSQAELRDLVQRVSEDADTMRQVKDVYEGEAPENTPFTARELAMAERERVMAERAAEEQAARDAAEQAGESGSDSEAGEATPTPPAGPDTPNGHVATPPGPVTPAGVYTYPSASGDQWDEERMQAERERAQAASEEREQAMFLNAISELWAGLSWFVHEREYTPQQVALAIVENTEGTEAEEWADNADVYAKYLTDVSAHVAKLLSGEAVAEPQHEESEAADAGDEQPEESSEQSEEQEPATQEQPQGRKRGNRRGRGNK